MGDAPWEQWQRRWEATAKAIDALGGEVRRFKVEGPARVEEIELVESRLGQPVPSTLRRVLLCFSRRVEFDWQMPEDAVLPDELSAIFAGECCWNLHDLVSQEQSRQAWVNECFPNPTDPYDRVWHDKLGWYTVLNGDCIAFDIQRAGEPVVYLSHEDGKGHGYVLGNNFQDYIDRLTQLACVGAEDWQWIIFCNDSTSGLDPRCDRATQWRSFLGLERGQE